MAQGQTAQQLFDEGVRLKKERKASEALQKFLQSERLKPGYTEALYEQGWCYNDLEEYEKAVDVLRKVVPVWTKIPKSFFELAYAFQNLGNMDSAVYYYNKTLELQPDHAGVFKQMGFMAYHYNKLELADEYFRKYEGYVDSPITDYLYWYRRGYVFNATKDFASAKESLLKCLSFEPGYELAYLELGYACSRIKQEDQAIAYYKKAIELDPGNYIGYNGIAEVYRDYKKDLAEAMTWYKKALEIEPDERKANFGIGYCLNAMKRYQEAIVYLEKAIAQEPNYPAAFVELGFSNYMLDNNAGAIYYFDKAIGLSPQNVNARYYKGLVYLDEKDKGNAQKMVDELKSLNSSHASRLQEKVNML